MSIQFVLSRQNRDGGWPYVHGGSWTEPTVYATLAMLVNGQSEPARRGLEYLRGSQLRDGGWPPQRGFDESTWVTALVALLAPDQLGNAAHARAIDWLMSTKGEESSLKFRVRTWIRGGEQVPGWEFHGWPWVPGTASWVGPTSLSILALENEMGRRPSEAIRQRIGQARQFLLGRMCRGGGWNTGSIRAFGYESSPYPETTGMALAALRGVRSPETERAIEVAGSFLKECRSADALNWLRIGLLAHGRMPGDYRLPAGVTCRTLLEVSLDMLLAGTHHGSSVFGL
jgi:hypothetical protein